MTTSGPPTEATTGSPSAPASAIARWIAWLTCCTCVSAATGADPRPVITRSLPRPSSARALTDPEPMSRPTTRRRRRKLLITGPLVYSAGRHPGGRPTRSSRVIGVRESDYNSREAGFPRENLRLLILAGPGRGGGQGIAGTPTALYPEPGHNIDKPPVSRVARRGG